MIVKNSNTHIPKPLFTQITIISKQGAAKSPWPLKGMRVKEKETSEETAISVTAAASSFFCSGDMESKSNTNRQIYLISTASECPIF